MDKSAPRMVSLRVAALTGAAVSAFASMMFVAGVYVAHARDGVAGGSPRTYVTVSGVITGLSGTPRATFHFHRRGVSADLCAPHADVALSGGGAFSVEVPLDDASARCPEGLFDGSDVLVDVDLPGAVGVVRDASVNPVPYAMYARQYGTPDCPVGYAVSARSGRTISCQRGNDQVVRVGTGPSAFWIDAFEASVWTNPEGTSGSRARADVPWGAFEDDFPEGFPDNGRWSDPPTGVSQPLYAVSRAGVRPTAFITWFQAQEACRLSGKQLPTGEQWLTSAQGTPARSGDPTTTGSCNTGNPTGPRVTGLASRPAPRNCISAWGAQDMVGNLQEWNAEWFAGLGVPAPITEAFWPDMIGREKTYNIVSGARSTDPMRTVGLPSAALRGGEWNEGGVFYLDLAESPANSGTSTGFRCVIPR